MWKIFKQGKASYYLVRIEIIWGMALLLIVSVVLLIYSYRGKCEYVGKEGEHLNYEHKIQPPVESGLSNIAECYLCGHNRRSLIGHYRGNDDLGIICINQWYIVGLGVHSFEEQNDFIGLQEKHRTSRFGTGEGGDFFRISQNFSRGISEIEIDYGENSILDLNAVRDWLCQKCLDKLLDVMDCYVLEGEEARPRDLCLIDFQTMELYTLQEHNRSYYIRDYYVQIAMDDSGAEVNVFYMPVLVDGGKGL